jgi:hypothetical protein
MSDMFERRACEAGETRRPLRGLERNFGDGPGAYAPGFTLLVRFADSKRRGSQAKPAKQAKDNGPGAHAVGFTLLVRFADSKRRGSQAKPAKQAKSIKPRA